MPPSGPLERRHPWRTTQDPASRARALASAGIALMGLLLIIAIIFGTESACSDSGSYSLDSAPNTLEQYCDQYSQLCATSTPN